MTPPATEFTQALSGARPGRALDLACGNGRHAVWLHDRGWEVTAVDMIAPEIEGITCVQADLEQGFGIGVGTWDLIVCWLYWQEDLLPLIRDAVRNGGHVALAGKTSGRFATSLERYRVAFAGWAGLAAGEDDYKAFFIAVKP